jgi:hypothetical protein
MMEDAQHSKRIFRKKSRNRREIERTVSLIMDLSGFILGKSVNKKEGDLKILYRLQVL